MKRNAQFEQPRDYKVILRDSYHDYRYYGLDDFDCKYLKIVQAKFGCYNSFHSIPDKVHMEMAPYFWDSRKQKFVLDQDARQPVQLNQLETLVSYTYANNRRGNLEN